MSETKSARKLKDSLQVAGVVFLIILIYSILHLTVAKAQIAPFASYQFNNPTPLNATTGGAGYNIGNSGGVTVSYGTGPVGQYMTRNALQGALLATPSFNPGANLSVQFLFRPTRDFQKYRGALALTVGDFSIYFAYPNVILQTNAGQSLIPLNQVGIASWQAIQDGNWHMISVTYAPASGQRRLYIDGQSPSGFTVSSPPLALSNSPMYVCGIGAIYDQFTSNIDEIYLYNNILSPNQVWQNYLDFQAGIHFTTAVVATVPPYGAITAGVNPLEYQSGNYAPDVQLDTFPYPRYKPIFIAADSFPPTLNFSDPTYLGGHALSWQPNLAAEIATAWKVAYRLCYKYNWAVPIYDWRAGNFPCTDSVNSFFGKMVALANRYTQFKASTITNFLLTPNGGGVTTNAGGNQGFAGAQYVKNGAGLFYDQATGGYSATPSLKEGRPSITKAQSIDGNHFADNNYSPDIAWYHGQAATLNTALTRPLDYNVDNNEGWTEQPPSIYTADPVIGPNITASGLSARNFNSRYVARYWTNYQDSIFRVGYADLLNVKASNYQMGGNQTYFYSWSEMRNVAVTYRGQKLATMDYYPLYPSTWYFESGPNHGFRFMMDCDSAQYSSGDRFMSNFVSPGWDNPETNHTSCVQFLGEMKDMVVKGNVTFYVSMFTNTVGGPNQPDVKDWIHSQVIPCYALATGTRMERIMHHGYCMDGDLPLDPTNLTSVNRKQFNTGDFRSYCVVRKDSLSNKYAIGINFNRNSNMVGNTPDSTISTISLGGQNITMVSHQKGDIYIYDNSDPANPLFYPLDEWHENKHPLYWSSDFRFQAEVNDNYDPQQPVQLKTTPIAANNYVNATTYISYKDTTTVLDSVRYNFTPTVTGTYYLWIRLKSRTGTTTGLKVRLNTGTVYTLPVSNSGWYWYRYDNGTVVAPGINYSLTANVPQHFSIIANDKYIEVDQIVFTKTANAGYPEIVGPCSATSTITPSGATSFCTGGSVTLTANVNISYLWSTGATTQAINVTTSGIYTVTVTDGLGCTGVSPSVTTTVTTAPTTPIISPSGATTFCIGGSVTLTSTAATSYLWSTGATTQAISVSTAGNYTVTVTNAGGCTKSSATTTVTTNALPGVPTITPTGATTFCSGSTVLLTATASTTYLWSTGAITQAITTGTAGGYTVTVTNAAGCTRSSATTTVTVDGIPIIAPLAPVQNVCAAVTVDLSAITLTNTGTAISGKSYHATLADAQNNVFPIAAVVGVTATYYIRCNTAAGCYSVVSQAVTIVNCACAAAPAANAGPDQNICATDSCHMAGSITNATVGTWTTSGTGTFFNTTNLTTYYRPSVADTAAGDVILTLTTDNPLGAPCAADVNTMNLHIAPHPVVSVSASGALTFCSGTSVDLVCSPQTTYLWSTGATTQAITVSTSGSYTVTGANVYGCRNTSAAKVINALPNPAPPIITASGSTTICTGGSVTLTSTTGLTYLWSTGATTASISASIAGAYRVTVSNSGGCTASSALTTVTVSPAPSVPIITPSGPTTFCTGGSVVLSTPSGYTYTWSTGATTNTITATVSGNYTVAIFVGTCSATSAAMQVTVTGSGGIPIIYPTSPNSICAGQNIELVCTPSTSYLWSTGATTQNITTSIAGSFVVTVTNSFGCSGVSSPSVVLSGTSLNPVITAGGPVAFCSGDSVTLTCNSATLYLWSTGATTSSIKARISGSYVVTVTDAYGCTKSSAAKVVNVLASPATPVITVVDSLNFCNNGSVALVAPDNYAYLWSNGTTGKSYTTHSSGTFTVTVSNALGCSKTSASKTTVMNNGCYDTCGVPIGIYVDSIITNHSTKKAQFRVNWAQKNSNTKYIVYVRNTKPGNNTRQTAVGQDIRKANIFDLTPNRSFYVWMRGKCGSTLTDSSAAFIVNTLP